FFVLLATDGPHRFRLEEKAAIRDAREAPIKFHGYAISYRGGHACVRIERGVYNGLKAYFLDIANRRSAKALGWELGGLRFEPYASVRRQLLAILRAVNGARAAAGYEPVPRTCFRFKRRIYRPFARAQVKEVA